MKRLLNWLRKDRATAREDVSLESRFTTVYEQRLWDSAESASGLGSELSSGQVTHALDLLRRMIPELGVRSIADVPCGDFNWMPVLLREHPEIDYHGYDVVPPLVAENQRKNPDHRFSVLDITTQVPARADLIFTKDLVNHLSERDVWLALANMVASGADYLMITNNTGLGNVDLAVGQPHASRYLDLLASPYSLPEPLYVDHYFVVWPREAVARRLEQRAA